MKRCDELKRRSGLGLVEFSPAWPFRSCAHWPARLFSPQFLPLSRLPSLLPTLGPPKTGVLCRHHPLFLAAAQCSTVARSRCDTQSSRAHHDDKHGEQAAATFNSTGDCVLLRRSQPLPRPRSAIASHYPVVPGQAWQPYNPFSKRTPSEPGLYQPSSSFFKFNSFTSCSFNVSRCEPSPLKRCHFKHSPFRN